MQPEAAQFFSRIRQRTAALSSQYSGFEVFEKSENALLQCINELGFRPPAESPDYIVMHQLREKLEAQISEQSAWAQVYIALWYGSNFGGEFWRVIVHRDTRNIKFAIQAALQIYRSSGSDSSAALGKLIKECSCSSEADRYLAELSQEKDRKAWAEKVRACMSA